MSRKIIPFLVASLVLGYCSYSQVVVSIPNGGERWDGGRRQYVRWAGGKSVKVELSTDNGSSWRVLSSSVPPGYQLLGFQSPEVSSLVCKVRVTDTDGSSSDVSDSVFSIRPSTTGTAWIQRYAGTLADLHSVVFVDKSRGWTCGDNGTLLGTTNGGVSWESLTSSTTDHLYSIRFSQRLVGIAAGTSGTILRTTDAGASWQNTPSGTASALFGVGFHGGSAVTVVGSNGTILLSPDAGISWRQVNSGTTSTLRSVSFLDSLHGVIAGGDGPFGGGGVFVLITADAGSTWALKPTYTDYFAWQPIAYLTDSVMVTAGGYSFGFGSRSAIVRSTNGGNDWSEVLGFSNIGTYGPIFSFADLMFVDSAHGFVSGGGDGCGMFIPTTNGGSTWDLSRAYYFDGHYMNASWFVTPTIGTLVGTGGTIFQTTSGGVVSVEDNPRQDLTNTFRLFQSYPNPFNPNTTIRFEIPNATYVSLRILDMLGREIAVLADEEMNQGIHERVFYAQHLSSGMYFCRMQTDSFTQTLKLMLLK